MSVPEDAHPRGLDPAQAQLPTRPTANGQRPTANGQRPTYRLSRIGRSRDSSTLRDFSSKQSDFLSKSVGRPQFVWHVVVTGDAARGLFMRLSGGSENFKGRAALEVRLR